jgi:hypothetical protein
MNRILIFSLTLLNLTGASQATTFYMTKEGAGAKNGASWENAFPISSSPAVLNGTMQPGDTLQLEGANYGTTKLIITSSGTSSARKHIIGVNRGAGLPLFQGTSGADNKTSNAGFFVKNGADYWTIQNLHFQTYGWGVRVEAGTSEGLIFDGISTRNCRNGMTFTDCDSILVINCDVQRYKIQGFHFAHSCNGVTVRHCLADMTGTDNVPDVAYRQGANPRGFEFHTARSTQPENTDILIEDCISRNNDQDTGTKGDFEQGDGFMIQGPNDRVTLRRCLAYNNQDSGYDSKGRNQLFVDCVSIRNANSGYKIWTNGTMTNCVGAYCGDQVIVIGVPNPTQSVLTANFCTFHRGNGGGGVRVERGSVGFKQADLKNCVLSGAHPAKTYRQHHLTEGISGAVQLNDGTTDDSKVHHHAGVPTHLPNYASPLNTWNGVGTHYDNAHYGMAKGYHSTRRSLPGSRTGS